MSPLRSRPPGRSAASSSRTSPRAGGSVLHHALRGHGCRRDQGGGPRPGQHRGFKPPSRAGRRLLP
ncbi:hypothetical protein QJS66_19195 [Kocuria rhizophila]|nr:hypothetical protein QJS66_19195 [Kocuria rhizophila]